MIRVLIVDDEPLARRGIRTRLSEAGDIEIVGECENGRQAVSAIREEKPHVVFLDIQMPGMDGFEVIAEIGADEIPVVVFVTAFDRHAVRAFDVHALDYLLKPIDDERFEQALGRARAILAEKRLGELGRRVAGLLDDLGVPERLSPEQLSVSRSSTARQQTEQEQPGRGRTVRFVIRSGARVQFVAADEIDWVEAAGDYVRIHAGKTAHLLRETMAAMQERLDSDRFLRIHRSTIVNTARIKELEPYFNGEYFVILEDGTKLKTSRGYRDALQAFLGEQL
jgi:two-component system LytT family response regulator